MFVEYFTIESKCSLNLPTGNTVFVICFILRSPSPSLASQSTCLNTCIISLDYFSLLLFV
jgi:hypothetical protein